MNTTETTEQTSECDCPSCIRRRKVTPEQVAEMVRLFMESEGVQQTPERLHILPGRHTREYLNLAYETGILSQETGAEEILYKELEGFVESQGVEIGGFCLLGTFEITRKTSIADSSVTETGIEIVIRAPQSLYYVSQRNSDWVLHTLSHQGAIGPFPYRSLHDLAVGIGTLAVNQEILEALQEYEVLESMKEKLMALKAVMEGTSGDGLAHLVSIMMTGGDRPF